MMEPYLLHLQALHQRFHRYAPLHSYLPGPVNKMADDASRLWHLLDAQIRTHFNLHYPQERTWKLCPPPPEMLSAVTSVLRRKPPDLESFLTEPKQPIPIGTSGTLSATASTWTQQSKDGEDPVALLQVYAQQFCTGAIAPCGKPVRSRTVEAPYVPLASRSLYWGPKNLG